MKKIVIMVLCMYLSTYAQFAGGSGTDDNPYEISTVTELDSIRHHLDMSFILTANLDFQGTPYNSLEEGWLPIGTKDYPFTGTFHGKGYVIENLTINRDSTEEIGLFGYCNTAVLDSVSVMGASIKGDNFVGGIAGHASSSEVKNSICEGEIEGDYYVGGIVGKVSFSTVEYSHASVIINGGAYIGGIAGSAYKGSILSSYSSGIISCREYWHAGIVGLAENESFVTNCYSSMTLKRRGAGVVGKASDTEIKKCYSIPSSVDGWSILCYEGTDVSNKYNYWNRNIYEPFESTYSKTIEEMMLEDTFTFWYINRSSTWDMIEGSTLPRLGGVLDAPIVVSQPDTLYTPGAFSYALEVVGMDDSTFTFDIVDAPQGMTISSDGVIEWTAVNGIFYPTIRITDGNGAIAYYSPRLDVISGNGTEENPFIVMNVTQLNEVRYGAAHSYIQGADIDLAGTEFDSINENSEGWVPINNTTGKYDFRGTYNGNGYTIKNLYINRPDEDAQALFGSLTEGVLKNITIEGARVTGEMYVGALVGDGDFVTVDSCTVEATVVGESKCGGLIGRVINSNVSWNSSNSIVTGIGTAGGLIGYLSSGKAVGCSSNSIVVSTSTSFSNVGGLIGSIHNGEVVYSSSTSEVKGQRRVGGLIGSMSASSTLKMSSSKSDVTGKTSCAGLVGTLSQTSIIEECFDSSYIEGGAGLAGSLNQGSIIKNCYSEGSYKEIEDYGFAETTYQESKVINSYNIMENYYAVRDTAIYINSYYDSNAVQKNYASVLAKNLEELKVKSTFKDWDFDSVWVIDEGVSTPTLRWETMDYVVSVATKRTYQKTGYTLIVAPTPTEDIATIIVESKVDAKGRFTIYGENGRSILYIEKDLYGGEQTDFEWSEINGLEKGVYFIEMKINNYSKCIQKLIKL